MSASGAERGRARGRKSVALVAALLLLAGGRAAEAGEPSGAEAGARERETGWRFGLVLDAAAVQHRVDTSVVALAGVATPLGDREGVELDGYSGSVAGRVWLPVRAGRLRPWLQAGYREPFGDLHETGAEARFPAGSIFGGPQADLRAEYTGGPHAAVGVDVELEAVGHDLALAPYAGWERAGYEARLQRFTVGSFLGLSPPVATHRDLTVDGVLAGLEARTPVLERGPVRLELLLGAEYLEPVDGEETLRVGPLATGELEVEDVLRGRAGLVVSF